MLSFVFFVPFVPIFCGVKMASLRDLLPSRNPRFTTSLEGEYVRFLIWEKLCYAQKQRLDSASPESHSMHIICNYWRTDRIGKDLSYCWRFLVATACSLRIEARGKPTNHVQSLLRKGVETVAYSHAPYMGRSFPWRYRIMGSCESGAPVIFSVSCAAVYCRPLE